MHSALVAPGTSRVRQQWQQVAVLQVPHLTVVARGGRLRGRSPRRPSTTSGRPRHPARMAAQESKGVRRSNGQ